MYSDATSLSILNETFKPVFQKGLTAQNKAEKRLKYRNTAEQVMPRRTAGIIADRPVTNAPRVGMACCRALIFTIVSAEK